MSRESRKAQQRPGRVPLSEQRNTLTVSNTDPNFFYRWFNDEGDRIPDAKRAGFEFVDKEGNAVGDPTVDTSSGTDSRMRKGVGGGKTAYLMRIPREIWEEDQARKEADLRETERAMRTLQSKSGHQHSQAADYGEVTFERK